LTGSLGWQPHTLRAALSRFGKPKSEGGEGLKIERTRTDGVTGACTHKSRLFGNRWLMSALPPKAAR
jgi:hypothetical protein